ncbi:MAG: hypothetical protein Q7R66_08370 [Undibacterium sp.]|nr:hypothetical protein [Undibacterium sp.]MDO8652188.1 hypothetical protein [Undibacterium sp.]
MARLGHPAQGIADANVQRGIGDSACDRACIKQYFALNIKLPSQYGYI